MLPPADRFEKREIMQNIEPQAEIELEGAEAAQMLKPYGAGIDTRSKFIAVCLRADVTRCSRRKSSRENGAGRKRVQGRIGQDNWAGRISPWSRLPPGSFFWGKKIIQNPARRKEDFDRKSRSKGEALREMAGKTGGWVKNHSYPHRRRAMGIGAF